MIRARPGCAAALILFSLASAAVAQMRVEVIPLRHRFPADVIPVIQPLLPAGASVTGMNNQLVVKTTPESLAEIRSLLDSIDQELRRLRIAVRQDSARFDDATRQSVSGSADLGDVTVRQDGSHVRGGVTVGAGDGDDHVSYQRRDRNTNGVDRADYEVQTVEGQPAFIRTGQSIPVPQRAVATAGGRVVTLDSVDYYDADSGFWVLPRLAGDNVTLLIAPRTTKVNRGALPTFDVQGAETTITGRLGQWMEIGGISQTSSSSGREPFGRDTHQSSRSTTLQVLVEEIP